LLLSLGWCTLELSFLWSTLLNWLTLSYWLLFLNCLEALLSLESWLSAGLNLSCGWSAFKFGFLSKTVSALAREGLEWWNLGFETSGLFLLRGWSCWSCLELLSLLSWSGWSSLGSELLSSKLLLRLLLLSRSSWGSLELLGLLNWSGLNSLGLGSLPNRNIFFERLVYNKLWSSGLRFPAGYGLSKVLATVLGWVTSLLRSLSSSGLDSKK
jgi:hypothetical protein